MSHAFHVIETKKACIAFDPVFFDLSTTGLDVFPKAKIQKKNILEKKFDAIFISHSHEDHFCLRSLRLFDQSIPIYFFGNVRHEKRFLEILGFQTVRLLKINRTETIGDVRITPIRNLLEASECGLQIEAPGFRMINLVDCLISEQELNRLHRRGPFDLVVFPFQEHNQGYLNGGDYGASVPLSHYKQRIELAARFRTRYMIPGSCQIEYKDQRWRNLKAFPITRSQFRMDVESLNKKTKVIDLLPGDSIEFKGGTMSRVENDRPFAKLAGARSVDYVYEPAKMPDSVFIDAGRCNEAGLAKAVRKFRREFPLVFSAACRQAEFRPLFKERARFTIEIVRGIKKKSIFIRYQLEDRKVRTAESEDSHFLIQIPWSDFHQAVAYGKPVVALGDGMRVFGQYQNLKTGIQISMTHANNPLLSYFFSTAVLKDRMRAIRQ